MDICVVWDNYHCAEFDLVVYEMERQPEITLHISFCEQSARCQAHQGHSCHKCRIFRYLRNRQGQCRLGNNSEVAAILTFFRLEARRTFLSFFKNDDFSTMLRRILSPHYLMRSIQTPCQ